MSASPLGYTRSVPLALLGLDLHLVGRTDAWADAWADSKYMFG